MLKFYSNQDSVAFSMNVTPKVCQMSLKWLTIEHFHPVYCPTSQVMGYNWPMLWTKVEGGFWNGTYCSSACAGHNELE